jgi:hypothetical protein
VRGRPGFLWAGNTVGPDSADSTRDGLLDWSVDWPQAYRHQDQVLWIAMGSDRLYLPQVVVFDPQNPWPENLRVVAVDPGEVLLLRDELAVDRHLEWARQRGQRLHDGAVARLVLADFSLGVLGFSSGSYLDVLGTNLALDRRTPESLRLRSSGDGKLLPLSQTPLANAAGINGLVFTADGGLVLQRRSADLMIRPNELCSGFSGTLEPLDLHWVGAEPFNVLRELEEELGVLADHVGETVLLGLTRELVRGGTPEFFAAVQLRITGREVQSLTPQDEEGQVLVVPLGCLGGARAGGLDSLEHVLTRCAMRGAGPLSLPLITNLAMWWRWSGRSGTGLASLEAVA